MGKTKSVTKQVYSEPRPSVGDELHRAWKRAWRGFSREWGTILGMEGAKSEYIVERSTLPSILLLLAWILPVCAFACWIVAALDYSFGFEVHDYMALATGILLVFRLETAYARYCEARKHLTTAQTAVQSVALVVITQYHRHYGDPGVKVVQALDDVRRYLLLWFWCMVNQLDKRDLLQKNVESLVTQSEMIALAKSRATPSATCVKWVGSRLAQLEELGYISPLQLHETSEGLEHMNEALTELEKISNTPQPFGIRQMTTGLAVFFVYTAPLALATGFAKQFDTFEAILARTLLSAFLLGTVYFAVNCTALALEHPCAPSKTEQALPLDEFVHSVQFDLNALFSDPIPPVVGAAEKDDKKSAVVSDIATRRGGKQMPAIAMSMGAACCRG